MLPITRQAKEDGIDMVQTIFQHTEMSDRGPRGVALAVRGRRRIVGRSPVEAETAILKRRIRLIFEVVRQTRGTGLGLLLK